MALRYMTAGLIAPETYIYQQVLPKVIDTALSKEEIDESQIIRIKKIMNKEIKRKHNKDLKEMQYLMDMLDDMSIDEAIVAHKGKRAPLDIPVTHETENCRIKFFRLGNVAH